VKIGVTLKLTAKMRILGIKKNMNNIQGYHSGGQEKL
jgi:hypothetical protein